MNRIVMSASTPKSRPGRGRVLLACLLVSILLLAGGKRAQGGPAAPSTPVPAPSNPWANAPGLKEFPGASAIILKDDIQATVNEDGTSELVEYDAIKMLDKSGLERFSRTTRLYDSRVESCQVTQARMWLPDGRRVDVPAAEITDGVPEIFVKHPLYSRMREVGINYPGAVEGAVVEFRIVHHRKKPLYGRRFWETTFTQDYEPILETSFTFTSPERMPVEIASPGLPDLRPQQVTREGGRIKMRWALKDRPRIVRQHAMPSLRQVASQIQVSNFASWDDFAAWEKTVLDQASAPDGVINFKTSAVVAGATSEARRIEAIVSWLGREKRPLGADLGLEEAGPSAAAECLNAPSLSMQDRAVLLLSMLRAAQVRAVPALVATSDYGDPERGVPSLPQFNRILIAILANDGTAIWIDPMAQAPGVLGQGLVGRPALILSGTGARFVRTPVPPVEASREEIQGVARLDPDGSMETVIKIQEFGGNAILWRAMLQTTPNREQQQLFQTFVTGINPTSVLLNFYVAPSDASAPLTMTLTFETTRATGRNPGGEGVRLPIPLLPQRRLISYAETPVAQRLYPVELGATTYEERRLQIVMPQGWTVKSLPRSVSKTNSVGSFQADVRARDRSIFYFTRLVIRRPQVPLAEYALLKELLDLVRETSQEVILLNNPAPRGGTRK